MKSRSFFRGAFWVLVALAFVFHVAGGWYFSGVLIQDGFVPDPTPIELPTEGPTPVAVTYTSPVGEMDAWYLEAPGSLWVVHVHGKGATPAEGKHLFGPIQRAGYPQLAITYRNDEGQPLDPSGYYRYGATEWEDMRGALEYAKANGARGVVFIGFSTGASHLLSYAYRHQIDDIRGFIFESPNIDLSDTVDYAATQRQMPVVPMTVPVTISWTAKFFTSLRTGVNWKSIDYISRADESLRVPTLVIHGTEDLSVPFSQSQRFLAASPELVTLVPVEGAGHVNAYERDPDGYLSAILTFLDRFR
jgi:uncharacterized protein